MIVIKSPTIDIIKLSYETYVVLCVFNFIKNIVNKVWFIYHNWNVRENLLH